MIDWAKVSAFERENAERICRDFFPKGKRIGGEWKIADVSGSQGDSLGVQLAGENAGLWHDRATGEGGRLRKLIVASRSLSDEGAVELLSRAYSVNFELEQKHSSPAGRSAKSDVRWESCSRLSVVERQRMAKWRGYSECFVQMLSENDLLRVFRSNGEARWVFPIHVEDRVTGTHSRPFEWNGERRAPWYVFPKRENGGPGVQPFVIGRLPEADEVHVFESTWDMLAICDKLSILQAKNVAAFCTRGSGNDKLATAIPAKVARVYIWQQNDGPGKGWARKVLVALPNTVSTAVVSAPAKFKDLNEWTKAEPDADIHSTIAKAEFEKHADGSSVDIAPDIRPKVLLPGPARPESEFAEEVGEVLHDLAVAFVYNGRVVEVEDEQFDGEFDHFKLARGGLKFATLTPTRAKTWIEQYIETGQETKVNSDRLEFVAKTMGRSQSESLLAAPQFLKRIPRVDRILDIAIPARTSRGEIIFPKPGFNKQLGVYVSPASPSLTKMDRDEALSILEEAYAGFCWKSEQAKVHAFARILTPFARGLMGFQERPPLWFFWGNRPRCGKDYLNGVTQIVYLGHAFEDVAITRNPDETTKRIVAALRAGRRMMHFANCQHHLDDLALIQAVTAPTFNSRSLGSNDADADLELSNEIEFSISANAGLTYLEDVEPRLRKIELSFDDEDANARVFPKPRLHEWVKENRQLLLSAIYSIVQDWVDNGTPPGKTLFNSFPRWAEVVGGIMQSASLGDPCLPHEGEELLGGDPKERAMKALYTACFEEHPGEWITKAKIYDVISSKSESYPAFEWFGDFASEKAHAVHRTGNALSAYQNRIFKGVRLVIDTSLKNSQNWRYKFVAV